MFTFSGQCKTARGGYTDDTKGGAWVWQYNSNETDATQMWGNYDSDGNFNQGTPHNLSKLSGTNGYYGASCSLSADGKTALIAGHKDMTEGCAYIWNYTNGIWVESSHNLNKTETNGYYGISCDLSGDGKTALVAGYVSSDTEGCAYIWTFNGSTWVETANLSKSTAKGEYGLSCSLSADGKTALIAGSSSADAGGAWIWTTVDGVNWNGPVDISKESGGKKVLTERLVHFRRMAKPLLLRDKTVLVLVALGYGRLLMMVHKLDRNNLICLKTQERTEGPWTCLSHFTMVEQ